MNTHQNLLLPRIGIWPSMMVLAGWSLLLAGCQSVRQDRFIVQASALDYMQIVRTQASRAANNPETVRIDLNGSGYLELTVGRSERVRSGFWQEGTTPAWEDWRRDYVVLSPETTLAYFQAFVNAGVFDQTIKRKPEQEPDLAIMIAIRNRKTLTLTRDPVFHQLFAKLLAEF